MQRINSNYSPSAGTKHHPALVLLPLPPWWMLVWCDLYSKWVMLLTSIFFFQSNTLKINGKTKGFLSRILALLHEFCLVQLGFCVEFSLFFSQEFCFTQVTRVFIRLGLFSRHLQSVSFRFLYFPLIVLFPPSDDKFLNERYEKYDDKYVTFASIEECWSESWIWNREDKKKLC